MKWKEVLLGATATLAVTVLGGIIVYYFTKEPDEKKVERLIYSVQQSASFKGESQNLAFATIRVENGGGIAAKRVHVLVAVDAAKILDFAVASDVGLSETERKTDRKKIQLRYETLLPNESITINLLLSSPEKPAVTVRSDSSLGIEGVLGPRPNPSKLTEFLQYAVPLTGILFGLLLTLAASVMRRGGYLEALSSDKNNAGFLMLHHGFVDDATAILDNSLHAGRYDPFTLSNLATCKALKGKPEEAKQLIRAANFRDRSGHAMAVILFNEAIISLAAGQKDQALAKLKEAIGLSPRPIRRYCQRSVHFEALRNDAEFRELLKES